MRSLVPSRLARLVVLLALLAVGGLAPAASADPQGPWVLPATDLSGNGTAAPGAAQVAVGPDGTTTVVWATVDGSTSTVYARTRPPGGTFGAAVAVSAPGDDAMTPVIATSADGTTVVAWATDTAPLVVRAAFRKGPTAAFGAPAQVSAAGAASEALSPAVAMSATGTATIAWWTYDSLTGDSTVQATTGTADGGFGAPATLASTITGEGLGPPQISAGAGQTLVVWLHNAAGIETVVTATRPDGGTFGAPVTVSPADALASGAVGAIAPDGSATVVYADESGGTAIEYATTRPAGGGFGTPAAIAPPAVFTGGDADLTIAPDGTRTAVWSSYDGADEVGWTATAGPSGTFPDPGTTPPTRLTAAGRSAFGLRVIASPDGTTTAVWSDGAQAIVNSLPRMPLLNYDVVSRTRPAGGVWSAATTLGTGIQPQVASRTRVGGGLAPGIGVGPNGVATAAWLTGTPVVLSAQRGAALSGKTQVASTAWPTRKLTVTTTPGGTVTSAPAGIDCGATCEFAFPELSEVTLTAAPKSPSTFAGWSGACSGTALTCKVSMSEVHSVTATFRPGLTVTRHGTGGGAVVSSPAGIRCGATCAAPFDAGAVVTLVATPAAGSGFTRWGGACTPVRHRPLRCTVSMNDVKAVTATFTRGAVVAGVTLGSRVIQVGTTSAGLSFRSTKPGTATVTLTSCRDVACASMAARVVAVKKVGKGRSTIRIPTRNLKVGRYRLAVRVTANRIVSRPATATLTVRARPHFTG